MTAVGGTEFSADSTNSANPSLATAYWAGATNDTNASALAYIPETSWNDTATTTPSISASGGGASTFFTKPVWQTGVGVPNDGQRDVPDIAFTASPNTDGYLICSQSSCASGYRSAQLAYTFDVIGGTSGSHACIRRNRSAHQSEAGHSPRKHKPDALHPGGQRALGLS